MYKILLTIIQCNNEEQTFELYYDNIDNDVLEMFQDFNDNQVLEISCSEKIFKKEISIYYLNGKINYLNYDKSLSAYAQKVYMHLLKGTAMINKLQIQQNEHLNLQDIQRKLYKISQFVYEVSLLQNEIEITNSLLDEINQRHTLNFIYQTTISNVFNMSLLEICHAKSLTYCSEINQDASIMIMHSSYIERYLKEYKKFLNRDNSTNNDTISIGNTSLDINQQNTFVQFINQLNTNTKQHEL